MVRKKILALLLLVIGATYTYGQKPDLVIKPQDPALFYVQIPNKNNVPTILSKSEAGITFHHKNTKTQTIFSKYLVYDFVQAFPTAKTPMLKEAYLVKASSIQLMHDLRKEQPNIYTFAEQTYEMMSLVEEMAYDVFTLPNDYGLEIPQTDMDLIEAETAWSYTLGDPNTNVGIVDTEFNTTHPELIGTINVVGTNGSFHGSSVASNLAANTNNGIGLASIGRNTFMEARTGLSLSHCLVLSQQGVKVINGSWGSPGSSTFGQNAVNEIYDNGTLLVFAAGNTALNTVPWYPASYNHVIGVTSIQHKEHIQPEYDSNGNYIGDVLRKKDTHDNTWVSQQSDGSHNHTYGVDLSSPGYIVPSISIWSPSGYGESNGTSNAAPIVTGTVGLMRSVNDNLTIEEVETILKLTSADIYQIPENSNYTDKLGAGRLDAGKAVEMAYKMAQTSDYIEVKDRDFYRDWAFEVKNAPFGIKIENETFRDTLRVDFTARNHIQLNNTVLKPDAVGYTVLSIDPSIPIPIAAPPNNVVTRNNSRTQPFLFDTGTYTLLHYVKNGKKEELPKEFVASMPEIHFEVNKEDKTIEAQLDGFCNESNAIYSLRASHLEVMKRGATSLTKCSIAEEIDFFAPVTGNIYMQEPQKEVFYQFQNDGENLWLWSDQTHKLVFSKTNSLDTKKIIEDQVLVYPNPANGIVQIRSDKIQIDQISLVNLQGKTLYMSQKNKETIDVSRINSGVYIIRIESSLGTFHKKIIVE